MIVSHSEDREEWLARLANHDLHLPFLQLDGLRAVLLILLQVCYGINSVIYCEMLTAA